MRMMMTNSYFLLIKNKITNIITKHVCALWLAWTPVISFLLPNVDGRYFSTVVFISAVQQVIFVHPSLLIKCIMHYLLSPQSKSSILRVALIWCMETHNPILISHSSLGNWNLFFTAFCKIHSVVGMVGKHFPAHAYANYPLEES